MYRESNCFVSPPKDAYGKSQRTGTDNIFEVIRTVITMPLSLENLYLEVMILQKELRCMHLVQVNN